MTGVKTETIDDCGEHANVLVLVEERGNEKLIESPTFSYMRMSQAHFLTTPPLSLSLSCSSFIQRHAMTSV